MKVAFVVNEFPSLSETFVLNQITGLLERGHQVAIFARSRGRQVPVHPDVTKFQLLARSHYLGCPRNKLIRLIQAPILGVNRFPKNPRAVLGSLNVLRYGKTALTLNLFFSTLPFYSAYDIVHCQFGENGHFGAVLKRLGLLKKLVVTFHGYDIRLGLERGPDFYKAVWQAGDCFLAISNYNYDNLVRLGLEPRKIVYHPVGIDCRRFGYREAVAFNGFRPVRLLTIARLSEEKGLEYGLRAIHQLLQRRPQLSLDYKIIGEGRSRAKLEALIEELGLTPYVQLLGAQSEETVIEVLRESDLFLLPSLAEALPVVLMEAQAVGLPVVATRVGSADQIVHDQRTGFLVPLGDPSALSQRLGYLVDHPERWSSMGKAGRQHVEQHYDINRLNDRLVRLYEQLLAA